MSRPPGRPRKPRPPELIRELQNSAFSYQRQMFNLEQEREQLRAERDKQIRRGHAAGLSTETLAEIFELSQPHISRIIRRHES